MRTSIRLSIVLTLTLILPRFAGAVAPTAAEMAEVRQWVAAKFEGTRSAGTDKPRTRDVKPFFSFMYDGNSSTELFEMWQLQRASRRLDEHRTEHTLTYTDQKTGLVVRCVGIEYGDFPTVEWTLYFKNIGSEKTPILEDIRPLDLELERAAESGAEASEFRLHHNVGGAATAQAYGPLETVLPPKAEKHIGGAGGRPTNSDMCYFNLEQAADKGVIIAIGWPGQWASRFTRDERNGLRVQAGQELTHFRLLPGEEVRSPLVLLQFWTGGDWLRAQNVWRRWFIAHGLRRPGGKLPPIQWCGGSAGVTNMMVNATEENQNACIDAYLARGLKPDLWWMDAGWYPCGGSWWNTGTWEFDKERFPNGLRPVTNHLHAKNIRAILWFEPERVTAGSWLAENRPEWLLTAKDKHGARKTHNRLLNLGNPEAWRWVLKRVDRLLTEADIDIYRQDFNIDPLVFWRANDTEDRQGITEIRYVTGLLAYWDELLRRHPSMLYDNCASGGRRNDLESMRRGVPYTKSDYWSDPVGVQGQTYGISLWLPYFAGSWGTADDPYTCRSKLGHTIGAPVDVRDTDRSYQERRKRLDEWRKIIANYWGDFWPSTPYSLDNAAWMAWQFNCPDSGRGVVQAFRRAESPKNSARFRLRGLEADAAYIVTNCDTSDVTEITGRTLLEDGLTVLLKDRPAAAIVTYQKKP